jgi:hypothetical protein
LALKNWIKPPPYIPHELAFFIYLFGQILMTWLCFWEKNGKKNENCWKMRSTIILPKIWNHKFEKKKKKKKEEKRPSEFFLKIIMITLTLNP